MTDDLEPITDDVTDDHLDDLLRRARALPEPTEHHRQTQTLSFAYGNLACSTNHKPSRKAFEKLAQDRYGWTVDEFNAWADTVKWEVL